MPENKVYGYIYKIINDFNNKVYIGQTSTTLEDRFARHCRDKSTSNKKSEAIDNLIQTIGKEHFQIIEIEKISIMELDNREIYWIAYYDSFYNGYNRTLGGQGGRKFSEQEILYALDLYSQNLPIKQIESITGIDEVTIYRYRRFQNIQKRKTAEHQIQQDINNLKKATLAKQIPIENITLQKIYSSKKEALCDMIEKGYSKAKDWHNIRAPLDKALQGYQKTFLGFQWRYVIND